MITPLLGQDVDILNSYFDKAHRYRIGALSYDKQALVFVDEALDMLYPVNTTPIRNLAETIYGVGNADVFIGMSATNFKAQLMTQQYESLITFSDGSQTSITLYQCSGFSCSGSRRSMAWVTAPWSTPWAATWPGI